MKLIMENWRKYNNDPFGLLCERYDKNQISKEYLLEEWQKTTEQELIELIKEINWEKEAELTADPDYKPPHERQGMLAKGLEKINDWMLLKTIQILEIGKRSAEAGIKGIKFIYDKIDDFCSEYYTLCKVIKTTLIVMAISLIMAILIDNFAEAKLFFKKKPVSDTAVDAMKGQLVDMIDRAEDLGKEKPRYYKLLAKIDDLHNAKAPYDFAKSKGEVDGMMKAVYENLRDVVQQKGAAKDLSKKEAIQILDSWIDIGGRTKAWYVKISDGVNSTLKYGKTLSKAVPK